VTDTESEPEVVEFPGARRPDRSWAVDSDGVHLRAYQWGGDDDPPLLLAHGGFDFAGTFDVFAPLLAEAGWRVVGWDQRGHGDSDRAALYSWDADLRDGLRVLESVTRDPVPVVGHSKGGGLMMALADLRPDRVSAVVNLDGLPSKRTMPDVPDRERSRLMAADLAGWLDHRRRAHDLSRKPGTLDELAARRGRMNPRLPLPWLRYLVTVGARRDPDGWRWKIDPSLRFGGFGPNRPEWGLYRLPGLGVPFLGVLGLELEEMGWGTRPEDIEPWLPPGARFHPLEGVGHFVHIERPREMADLVLEFLS
jgi:pimeloyl-ACP methyl ester carboxylesterase